MNRFHMVLNGLQDMAEHYHERFGSTISEDYVLREYWLDMLRGLRGMLNGETENLDCGQFDGFCVNLARKHGFDDSEL